VALRRKALRAGLALSDSGQEGTWKKTLGGLFRKGKEVKRE